MVRSPAAARWCKRIITELEHMWIDPQAHEKRHGRALFQHTKRRAEELGLHTLSSPLILTLNVS